MDCPACVVAIYACGFNRDREIWSKNSACLGSGRVESGSVSGPEVGGSENFCLNRSAANFVHAWPRAIKPEEVLSEMMRLRGLRVFVCHLVKSVPAFSLLYVC